LEAGRKLPDARQLPMQVGVSGHSLREAPAQHVSEGVLLRSRGGGTTISCPHATWSTLQILSTRKTMKPHEQATSSHAIAALVT
ncbi:GntR family transcriptional regulator, partial [Escherichia coli]|uniref:GntR family transcriptional regulator n=1 Tax=Escherichia coli TaxID=562 RepID=UPI0012B9A7D7|nr:GntR family transcriptional regulator [Escherichia coli]